jgi:hypothetical protein
MKSSRSAAKSGYLACRINSCLYAWDVLEHVPGLGTIHNAYVPPEEGTSGGDYTGWPNNDPRKFKQECERLGAEAAKKQCEDRIFRQLLGYLSEAAGILIAGDAIGGFAGLGAAVAAKRAGVGAATAWTGVGAAVALDGLLSTGLTMKDIKDIMDAAKNAMDLQCDCPGT